MRYGYWLPVFGGWLRNVEDEQMEATWEYASRLARRSEEIGFDLTLIAELNLNDIKGAGAPALDAWSTAAALAAVTRAHGGMARSRRPDVETGSLFFLRKLLSGGGFDPAAKANLTATASDLRRWRIGSGEGIDK